MTYNLSIQKLVCIDVAVMLILLDQFSKWFVTEHILRPNSTGSDFGFIDWLIHTPEQLRYAEIEITSFFNLVMVWNEGVSFGMLTSGHSVMPLILSVLAIAVSGVFTIWLFRSRNLFQMIGIAFVIGGALGNVIDRMRFGAVIDFLDFHIMGYHWPAFNLADSCITVGILMLIAYSLFFEKKDERQKSNA